MADRRQVSSSLLPKSLTFTLKSGLAGAFQRARYCSHAPPPKRLTFDSMRPVRFADAGRACGRSPGHSTTYVTQPASSRCNGCNVWRLYEARLAHRQSMQPADRASTAPENSHLWLTGKDARPAACLLPRRLLRCWRGRLVAKGSLARDSRKSSPFARRKRHAHSIDAFFSSCTATRFFITSTIAVLTCAGRWPKNSSSF